MNRFEFQLQRDAKLAEVKFRYSERVNELQTRIKLNKDTIGNKYAEVDDLKRQNAELTQEMNRLALERRKEITQVLNDFAAMAAEVEEDGEE